MRAVLMLVITWMILSPEIVTKTQAAPARHGDCTICRRVPQSRFVSMFARRRRRVRADGLLRGGNHRR